MSGLIIPAITLWQPWACLIEVGVKPYETRPKAPPKKLIGQRIAIHAAKRPMKLAMMSQEFIDACYDAFGGCHWSHALPLGVVVCTAILAEAVPVEQVTPDLFGDYSPGRWAWKLEDVRPVQPHAPAKGMQLWGWPWTVPEGMHV